MEEEEEEEEKEEERRSWMKCVRPGWKKQKELAKFNRWRVPVCVCVCVYVRVIRCVQEKQAKTKRTISSYVL